MKNFIVVDENENILQHGRCLDEVFDKQINIEGGVTLIEGTINEKTQKIVDGKIVNINAE